MRTRPVAIQEWEREARAALGRQLREAREQVRLPLREVAHRAGFNSYRPLWLIEDGRMAIPPDRIRPLEDVLGLPARSVFWAECRLRLRALGFDLDDALQEMEPQQVETAIASSLDIPAPIPS